MNSIDRKEKEINENTGKAKEHEPKVPKIKKSGIKDADFDLINSKWRSEEGDDIEYCGYINNKHFITKPSLKNKKT